MENYIKIGNLIESLKREKELYYKMGKEDKALYEKGERPNGWHTSATCNAYANGIDYAIRQLQYEFKQELKEYGEYD